MIRPSRPILFGLLFAVLASTATYALTVNHYNQLLAKIHPAFIADSPFKLLHPVIGISLPADQFSGDLGGIRNSAEQVTRTQPPGTLSRYSIYFKYLDSGTWTGINYDDGYNPASLLKVVVAIAAYRQAQDDPSYLDTPLVYTQAIAEENSQVSFSLPTGLQVGRAYKVTDLIQKELSDSDNGAVFLLLSSIKDNEINSVYDELSVPRPGDTDPASYKITAREYARFFRVLYNGTLDVDWAGSEKILEYLSQSTYAAGLVAGVPDNITVAHKYGEHVNAADGAPVSVELSDCGIVYHPAHPYFLCVMTEGKDQNLLAGVIRQISSAIYGVVDKK